MPISASKSLLNDLHLVTLLANLATGSKQALLFFSISLSVTFAWVLFSSMLSAEERTHNQQSLTMIQDTVGSVAVHSVTLMVLN